MTQPATDLPSPRHEPWFGKRPPANDTERESYRRWMKHCFAMAREVSEMQEAENYRRLETLTMEEALRTFARLEPPPGSILWKQSAEVSATTVALRDVMNRRRVAREHEWTSARAQKSTPL